MRPRSPRHQPIGYVPQKVLLDPDLPMRARDLVALGLDGNRYGIPLPSRGRGEAVRAMLHAVDADGRLHVGADCAIEIWRRTPGDGWLARLLGLPVLRQVSRFGYDRFADLLYAWNRRKGHW